MAATPEIKCPKCGKAIAGQASYCASCGTRVFRDSKGAETSDPYLGETIDGIFEVESILGKGSMGIVYKARHRALNCHVALKVLRHDFLSDRVVLTRFQREAQAASCLSHPNVIHILHYGKTSLNAPYIAMECLEGEELAVLIPKQFPLDQRRVASIALQTARALSAAHAANIIHRDLKPANIVVIPKDGRETVKVLDFGIAKIADVEGEGLTKEGAMCGTPAFMSPEQILCQKVTPASDLFSLGSIMYYMLTCKLPFNGTSLVEMVQSILNSTPPAPSNRLDIVVDPRLEAICMKALEKDPKNRYQSADEICRDLEDALLKMGTGVPIAKPKVVVGDANLTMELDAETKCSIPAMPDEDESEKGTVVGIAAMDDAVSCDHDTVEVFSSARNTVKSAVGAVGEVFTDVFAGSNTVRTLAPDECTVIHDSMLGDEFMEDGEESKEETLARRKKLMLGLVFITASISIIGVLILVFISWITRPNAKADSYEQIEAAVEPGTAENGKLAGAQKGKNEPVLGRDEIEYLSGVVTDKSVDATRFALGRGLPSIDDEELDESDVETKPADIEVDEAIEDKPEVVESPKKTEAPKKAEVKKTETTKKSVSKPAAAKPAPKAPAKTAAAKTSGTSAAKLQQAMKLEATDKVKACEVYKSLLKDASLSQTDKLKVQSKVRSCGRISI